MNKTVLKNLIGIICLSSIGIVMTILGLKMLVENQTRDLEDVLKLEGTVEFTEVVTEDKKVGAVPFKHIEQDYLGIKLNEHDQLFGTFNPKQSYSHIEQQLSQGKRITIFYYDSSDQSPTNNIYQIEANGQLIIDHADYQKNHSIAATVITCFGIICLIMLIWILKTKKITEDHA